MCRVRGVKNATWLDWSCPENTSCHYFLLFLLSKGPLLPLSHLSSFPPAGPPQRSGWLRAASPPRWTLGCRAERCWCRSRPTAPARRPAGCSCGSRAAPHLQSSHSLLGQVLVSQTSFFSKIILLPNLPGATMFKIVSVICLLRRKQLRLHIGSELGSCIVWLEGFHWKISRQRRNTKQQREKRASDAKIDDEGFHLGCKSDPHWDDVGRGRRNLPPCAQPLHRRVLYYAFPALR